MSRAIDLLHAADHAARPVAGNTLALANDADPLTVPLDGVDCIELHFPKFTDGRAFSQAALLRQRRAFAGVIRATGEVLIDQLVQMQRTGFSQAVLRDDQDLEHGRKLLAHYQDFYQGDAVQPHPLFLKTA